MAGLAAMIFFLRFKKYLIAKYKQNMNIFKSRSFGILSLQLFFLYSIFFLIQGLILNSIIGWTVDVGSSATIPVLSAFILAWVLGFIIPGVPGGIGVREMALVFMLSDVCGAEVILSAAIIQRLVSILGEILAYLLSVVIVAIAGLQK